MYMLLQRHRPRERQRTVAERPSQILLLVSTLQLMVMVFGPLFLLSDPTTGECVVRVSDDDSFDQEQIAEQLDLLLKKAKPRGGAE